MNELMTQLFHDEAGFIVSAELILVATITVLSMVVGLSEISTAVNEELEDVGTAFGKINQSFRYSGLIGHKGKTVGSFFGDEQDFCDSAYDIVASRPGRGGENHSFGRHDDNNYSNEY